MVDVAEIQLMKASGFSDGTDNYKGLLEAGYRENPLNTVPIMLEGDLRPTRIEQVKTDTPPVSVRLRFSGPAPSALLDTTIAAASYQARDVTTAAGTKTVTFTNLLIKSSDVSVNDRNVGGVTYEAEATAVAIT